jgi:iron complex outermembrane receptor protein
MANKLLLLFFFFPLMLSAQQWDSLFQLDPVEVSDSRLQSFSPGSHITTIDSSLIQLSTNNNLAEVLSNNSQIYIKNYGPGRLATSAIRGAGASHTTVLWNGFNIQNSMLGQVDLSLLPTQIATEVSINYSSSSALWGSGALGGSIHLNSPAKFNTGLESKLNLSVASFGQSNQQLSLNNSREKWSTRTSLFRQNGTNNFTFINNGVEKRQTNAQLNNLGLIQGIAWKPNQKHLVDLQIWYQDTEREIPPLRFQTNSAAKQEDQALRNTFLWKYIGENYTHKLKAAFFKESLIYTDSIADINSDSRTQSSILESEHHIYLSEKHSFRAGVFSNWLRAESNNYVSSKNQLQSALFLSYLYQSLNQKWTYSISLRQELVDQQWSPFTPSVAINWQAYSNWEIKASINRNYRLPTFNDLYYTPGGNPDLQAESGWSEDVGLYYQHTFGQHQIKVNTSLFNRNISNWIIWLPNGNVWSPENVQEVWSRGLENRLSWFFTNNKLQLQVHLGYDFIRSTNQKSKSPNDASVGKQLIYVPQHKVNGRLQLNYQEKWQLAFWQNYTDSVFLLADNSSSLPAYALGNLSLAKTFHWSKINATAIFKINNIWDKDYEVVVNRPMPGQNFEFNIQIAYKK